MKESIWISMISVKKKLNSENRKFCFEIFGYDFIMDSDLNVWLIEVNTNPCLEESSPLLEMLIPRMIGKLDIFKLELDDAFKITLDIIFPPPNQNESK